MYKSLGWRCSEFSAIISFWYPYRVFGVKIHVAQKKQINHALNWKNIEARTLVKGINMDKPFIESTVTFKIWCLAQFGHRSKATWFLLHLSTLVLLYLARTWPASRGGIVFLLNKYCLKHFTLVIIAQSPHKPSDVWQRWSQQDHHGRPFWINIPLKTPNR